jgi:hypothetical protein
MQTRPLLALAVLAAASEPDFGAAKIAQLKESIRDRYVSDPMGTTATTLLAAAYLFYRAEHETNPKVDSYYAALEYIASSLSVGYTDIYPKTPLGKSIASMMMTMGPGMVGGLFDGGNASRTEAATTERHQAAVVERLDRILAALQRERA